MKRINTASSIYYRYLKTSRKFNSIYGKISEIAKSETLEAGKEKVLKQLLRKLNILYKRLKKLLTLGKVSTAALTTAFVLLTGSVSAQSFSEVTGSSNPFDGVDVGYYSNPAFVDIDADGDLDVFIGERYGSILYYQNTGTAATPAFSQVTGVSNPLNSVNVGRYACPVFVDIDSDGDFDAFSGDYYGAIHYYENTGTAAVPAFSEITGGSNPFYGVNVINSANITLADIDGDGDFDAFLGSSDGTVYYYENTGTALAPTFSSVTGGSNPLNSVNVGSYSLPVLEDLDSDGDFDAFVGAHDGTVYYYENTGTAAVPAFSEVTGSSNPLNSVSVVRSAAVAFADLDADGDLDAFIGGKDGYISYFENTYTAVSPSMAEASGTDNPFNGEDMGYNAVPAFADLDSDGDYDAFIGSIYGNINYYQNTGTPLSPTFTKTTGSSNPLDGVALTGGVKGGYSSPVFVDIDSDGDLDVFIGSYGGEIHYYQNTGTAISPTFSEITGTSNPFNGEDVGYYAAPAFADLDGDGDYDAFIGAGDGTINYYENSGTVLSPTLTEITNSSNPFYNVTVGGSAAPVFADLDGDGDLDAFIGETSGAVNYYRNDGTAISPSFTLVTGSSNPFDDVLAGYSNIALADLDGDGDLDALIGDSDGLLYTYVNGESTLPVELSSFTGNHNGTEVVLCWATSTEVNNHGFDIERQSVSGGSWSKVGFVAGSGAENAGQSYTFTDTTELPSVDTLNYRLKQWDIDGVYDYSKTIEVIINNSSVTGVEESDLPTEFGLSQNYPNPFNPTTTIEYQVPESGNVTLKVYDMLGREVMTLVNEDQSAGYYTVTLNAGSLASGVYIYRLQAGEFVQTKKMVLMK